jgi:preprotein translocase subunit SecB
MSENLDQGAQPGQFSIQRLYIKDISFETPNSPEVFMEHRPPEINLQLSTHANTLDQGGVYEVVLTLTVTAKYGDKTAFLVEVHQAGVFTIRGFNDEGLGHMLNSYCPNILFPYGREVVSDLVTRGGFPQLLLAPVNFDALYAHHLEQKNQQVKESPLAS